MYHIANVPEESLATAGYEIFHAVLIIVFVFLACTALAARLWSRRIQRLAFIASDYVTILGLIFALVDASITLYACCHPSIGKDGVHGSPMSSTLSFKLQFFNPLIWVLAVTTIRVAVILLYMHIVPSRPFHITCFGVIAFNVGFLIATIFAECLICRPISYRWNTSIKNASCGDEQALTMYTAGLNLLQDVIVVVLPMPVLLRLQMAPYKKLGVACLFGLGIAICAVTSYRVYVTSIMRIPSRANRAECDIGVLTALETLLGIITACLPMAKPVAVKFWMWLPNSGRSTVRTIATAMGVERRKSLEGKSVGSEERDGDEKRDIWIERHFDVESVNRPHS